MRRPFATALAVTALLVPAATAAAVTVKTPDVTNRSYASAVATLNKAHLCFRVYMLNSFASQGRIIRVVKQSPPAGSRVPEWAVVAVTVPFSDLPALSLQVPKHYPCRHTVPKIVSG
jgi:beta-lactam-binding protein with PASTA domain